MNEINQKINESYERFMKTDKEERMLVSEQVVECMDTQVRNMVNLWMEKFKLEECPEVWVKLYAYLMDLEETLKKSLDA
ncbi:hypothetical protein [Paenibacillus silvae]|uniref:Uncharacterized protein n=1 Tax=Paenibacillus silvae TaxID=1325358 RepID=A0A2W6NNJ4_9BACL|nr:hypothetical protein [Paenibacillus silvae]PZT57391.1 hypothetical protein DN757_01670 [Paenibacillus silvae]